MDSFEFLQQICISRPRSGMPSFARTGASSTYTSWESLTGTADKKQNQTAKPDLTFLVRHWKLFLIKEVVLLAVISLFSPCFHKIVTCKLFLKQGSLSRTVHTPVNCIALQGFLCFKSSVIYGWNIQEVPGPQHKQLHQTTLQSCSAWSE